MTVGNKKGHLKGGLSADPKHLEDLFVGKRCGIPFAQLWAH